ncbi:hypothetical protein AADZ91_06550 [Colwelliaceae bacterium 6441]
MQEGKSRDPLIDRRASQDDFQSLWSHLTLAQKFSASSLAKYGYQLSFMRCYPSGNIAIMQLDNNVTTISCDGDIDTNPSIHIR